MTAAASALWRFTRDSKAGKALALCAACGPAPDAHPSAPVRIGYGAIRLVRSPPLDRSTFECFPDINAGGSQGHLQVTGDPVSRYVDALLATRERSPEELHQYCQTLLRMLVEATAVSPKRHTARRDVPRHAALTCHPESQLEGRPSGAAAPDTFLLPCSITQQDRFVCGFAVQPIWMLATTRAHALDARNPEPAQCNRASRSTA